MRVFSQAQDNVALRQLRISLIGVDDRAISNASSKLSLILSSEAQLVANAGA